MKYKLRTIGVLLAGLILVGLITVFFLNDTPADMPTRIQQQLERDYPWVTVGNVYHYCFDKPDCTKTAAILIVLPHGQTPPDAEFEQFNVEALNMLYDFSVDTDIVLVIAFAQANVANQRFAYVLGEINCEVVPYKSIDDIRLHCELFEVPGAPVAVPMIAE